MPSVVRGLRQPLSGWVKEYGRSADGKKQHPSQMQKTQSEKSSRPEGRGTHRGHTRSRRTHKRRDDLYNGGKDSHHRRRIRSKWHEHAKTQKEALAQRPTRGGRR
ncbi:MAG: hypothetical protein K5633_04250 [Paludibacteraceae bacterium]|nr:hypothetical protein [Paludibacteraceae bacterium]